MNVNANDLIWYGRNLNHNGIRYFDYSCSGFCFVMKGKKALAHIVSDPESWDKNTLGVLGVYISEGTDISWASFPEELNKKITLDKKENECLLFESDVEKTVCIRVIKISEAAFGYAGFKGLEIDGELCELSKDNDGVVDALSLSMLSKFPEPYKTKTNIEIIGDSITCGYGIEGVWEKDSFTTQQQRADKSYAFLTAKALNANLSCCSWSGIGIISNYVDPETAKLPDTHWLMPGNWPYTDKSLSLRLGLEPEVWDEKKFSPDIVVIHLGTNDQSWVHGHEERRLGYVAGMRQLIEAVHRRSPKAKICCCLGIMGQELCDSVEEALKLFHDDFKNVPVKFVKFPVQDEKDGIAADWHPSATSHKKMAQILSDELRDWTI